DLGQRPIGLQAFATWNLGAHLVNALPALEKQAPSEQLHQAKGDETSADKLAAWLASLGAPAVRDWHFARLGARQQCFVSKSACWRPNARAPPAGIVCKPWLSRGDSRAALKRGCSVLAHCARSSTEARVKIGRAHV